MESKMESKRDPNRMMFEKFGMGDDGLRKWRFGGWRLGAGNSETSTEELDVGAWKLTPRN